MRGRGYDHGGGGGCEGVSMAPYFRVQHMREWSPGAEWSNRLRNSNS